MTTFRMIKNTVNKVWNIWQVVDEDGLKQAGMRLNGDQQALEFFLTTMEGDVQTVTFPGLSVLFNTKWHKVMVGVEKELVTLYVDCHPVDQKPIKRKGYVNTEGDTLIGRLDSDPNTSVVVRGNSFISCFLYFLKCVERFLHMKYSFIHLTDMYSPMRLIAHRCIYIIIKCIIYL